MAYNIHYASGANQEDTGLPPQLMAGDTPAVVTQDFPFDLATAIGQFVPLTRDGDTFEPWAAGDQVDAISAYDIPTGASRAAVYVEGMFNIDALLWPEGTTEVEAMTAMTGDVKYRKLLHSDHRTGNESLEVGPGNEAGQNVLRLAPAGTVVSGVAQGAAWVRNFTASKGVAPYTYAVSGGALPTGTSLNASTGATSGNASAAGSYAYTITATDANGLTVSGTYSTTITA